MISLFVFSFTTVTFARDVISINKNWNFTAGIEIPAGMGWGRAPEAANSVDLPHTWNHEDFMSDRGYRRGYGSYRKELDIPKEILRKPFTLQSCGMYFIHLKVVGDHTQKKISSS